MMKAFFQAIGLWNIFQKGFNKLAEYAKLLSSAIKELERNKRLDCTAFHYLSTKIQLHIAKKFIHTKTAKNV